MRPELFRAGDRAAVIVGSVPAPRRGRHGLVVALGDFQGVARRSVPAIPVDEPVRMKFPANLPGWGHTGRPRLLGHPQVVAGIWAICTKDLLPRVGKRFVRHSECAMESESR